MDLEEKKMEKIAQLKKKKNNHEKTIFKICVLPQAEWSVGHLRY